MIRCLMVSLLVVLGPGGAWAQSAGVAFGLIASESPQAILSRWQPLLDDLARQLGRPVRGEVFDDYAGVIWAMGAGRVQVAWVGNKAAIEAVDRAGGQIAVKSVGADGSPGYCSHLIARKDSPLATEEDVLARAPELVFAYGDPNSTSGHAVPGYYLFAARGLDPRRLFKRVTEGSHEQNFLAVAEGRADVGTSNSVDLGRFRQRHPAEFERIKVIWSSPLIPSDPIVWRKDLAADLKAALRGFLLAYGRSRPGVSAEQLARERTTLSGINWSGFAPSDDCQLTPIRQLEMYRQRLRIESDASISATERDRRLKDIDARTRALDDCGQ